MTAYYNEIDKKAAAWLRELIRAGLIAPGEVDDRDIRDVTAHDLRGFTQHHFFAGIGVWSYALRRAGWGDDRPVWTGSCPCQPFSAAGKGAGFADERHLWPSWFRLIQDFKPQTVLGEQVASRAAIGGQPTDDLLALWRRQELLRLCENWLEENSPLGLQGMPERGRAGVASVQTIIGAIESEPLDRWRKSESSKSRASVRSNGGVADDETGSRCVRDERASVQHGCASQLEHAVARSDQSIGGLHDEEHAGRVVLGECGVRELGRGDVFESCADDIGRTTAAVRRAIDRACRALEEADGESWLNTVQSQMENAGYAFGALDLCAAGFGAPHIRQRTFFVADTDAARSQGRSRGRDGANERAARTSSLGSESGSTGPTNGIWRDADWLLCRDGKWRPVSPGTFPLVDGSAARVGRLRGYGNAIVAPVAQAFIEAVMEYLDQ